MSMARFLLEKLYPIGYEFDANMWHSSDISEKSEIIRVRVVGYYGLKCRDALQVQMGRHAAV